MNIAVSQASALINVGASILVTGYMGELFQLVSGSSSGNFPLDPDLGLGFNVFRLIVEGSRIIFEFSEGTRPTSTPETNAWMETMRSNFIPLVEVSIPLNEVQIHGNLEVDGKTNMGGDLSVDGKTNMGGDLSLDGNAKVNGTITIPVIDNTDNKFILSTSYGSDLDPQWDDEYADALNVDFHLEGETENIPFIKAKHLGAWGWDAIEVCQETSFDAMEFSIRMLSSTEASCSKRMTV
jgi:hypothetical protein